jgi:hypothetical protein
VGTSPVAFQQPLPSPATGDNTDESAALRPEQEEELLLELRRK